MPAAKPYTPLRELSNFAMTNALFLALYADKPADLFAKLAVIHLSGLQAHTLLKTYDALLASLRHTRSVSVRLAYIGKAIALNEVPPDLQNGIHLDALLANLARFERAFIEATETEWRLVLQQDAVLGSPARQAHTLWMPLETLRRLANEAHSADR